MDIRLIDRLATWIRSGRPYTDMGGPHEDRPPPPVAVEDITAAEARLGFALPELLRSIYLQVANGGFGPGYGLYGLEGDSPIYDGLPDINLPSKPIHSTVTEKLLPICTWGCQYFSYLDCMLPQAPVMAIDTNSHGYGPGDCAFSLHAVSLEEWVKRWVDGENLWESIGLYGEPKFGFENE